MITNKKRSTAHRDWKALECSSLNELFLSKPYPQDRDWYRRGDGKILRARDDEWFQGNSIIKTQWDWNTTNLESLWQHLQDSTKCTSCVFVILFLLVLFALLILLFKDCFPFHFLFYHVLFFSFERERTWGWAHKEVERICEASGEGK